MKEVWGLTGNLYIKVWKAVKDLLKVQGYTSYSLLWNGDNFLNLSQLEGEMVWGKYGIRYLSQLFETGSLKILSTYVENLRYIGVVFLDIYSLDTRCFLCSRGRWF